MEPRASEGVTGFETRQRAAPIAVALLVVAVTTAALLRGQIAGAPNINLAEARFRLGEFTEAEEMAAAVLEADPNNFRAVLLQGRVALLGNRLSLAEERAGLAAQIRPTHRAPREILAEVHVRRGSWALAAPLFVELRRKALGARAATFAERAPFDATGVPGAVSFSTIDPLPTVRASVNGSPAQTLLLDTGTAAVTLDEVWATEIGVEEFGSEKTDHGVVRYGRLDTLRLDGIEMRDVPVDLVPSDQLPDAEGSDTVRGVLGSSLLSRFRATIDFPGGSLRFAPPGAFTAPPEAHKAVFYLTPGGHIVVRGAVNDHDRQLLLLATGRSRLGFTAPTATLEAAGVELLEGGPGAKETPLPFMLEKLSLGGLTRAFVPGVEGVFRKELEHELGFRVGGLVSHGFVRPYAVTLDFSAMEIWFR